MNSILISYIGRPELLILDYYDSTKLKSLIGTEYFNRLRCNYLDDKGFRISIFYDPNSTLPKNFIASRIAKIDINGIVILIDGNNKLELSNLTSILNSTGNQITIITYNDLTDKKFYGLSIDPEGNSSNIEFTLSEMRNKKIYTCPLNNELDYRLTIFYSDDQSTDENFITSQLAKRKMHGTIIITDDDKKLTFNDVKKIIVSSYSLRSLAKNLNNVKI